MRVFTLSVKNNFDSSHHIPRHPGKCANTHGHTWTVTLDILIQAGSMDAFPGILIDFSDAKKFLKDICEEYDHKNLNLFFAYPSAENISSIIATKAARYFSHPDLTGIRCHVQEGTGGICTCTLLFDKDEKCPLPAGKEKKSKSSKSTSKKSSRS